MSHTLCYVLNGLYHYYIILYHYYIIRSLQKPYETHLKSRFK